MEHIPGNQWWTRYQPVTYNIISRSGDRAAMINMIKTCHKAGVKIYADAVLNHVAAGSGVGINGTKYGNRAVEGLYSQNDFHHGSDPASNCVVNNYNDQNNVQSCDLVGLTDLCTGCAYVQKTLGAYLTDLGNMGVDGFRMDASKHQEAGQLGEVLKKGPANHFTFHEVISGGGEPVTPQMYFGIGSVTEFNYARTLSPKLLAGQIDQLQNFGTGMGLIQSDKAVVFIDNHDTQRGEAKLTYKNGPLYTLANVFMLAHPYGYPKVMSSYAFSDHDAGPPSSAVHSGSSLNCDKGQWVCEHRR
jgi:alpha-amylase